MQRSRTPRTIWATLALLLSAGASAALAQDGHSNNNTSGSKPLVIAKQGYFFVGGTYHTFGGAQYVSGWTPSVV